MDYAEYWNDENETNFATREIGHIKVVKVGICRGIKHKVKDEGFRDENEFLVHPT